jgi:hypothetical protein
MPKEVLEFWESFFVDNASAVPGGREGGAKSFIFLAIWILWRFPGAVKDRER